MVQQKDKDNDNDNVNYKDNENDKNKEPAVYHLKIPHTENAMILARFGSSGELIFISSGQFQHLARLVIKMRYEITFEK